jgi:hypothetical protein
MSGMSLASRQQVIEDMRQLIAELERLKVALGMLGRWAQVKTVEKAIKGVSGMLGNMERSLYNWAWVIGLQDRLFIALIVLAMLGAVTLIAVVVLPRWLRHRASELRREARTEAFVPPSVSPHSGLSSLSISALASAVAFSMACSRVKVLGCNRRKTRLSQ